MFCWGNTRKFGFNLNVELGTKKKISSDQQKYFVGLGTIKICSFPIKCCLIRNLMNQKRFFVGKEQKI